MFPAIKWVDLSSSLCKRWPEGRCLNQRFFGNQAMMEFATMETFGIEVGCGLNQQSESRYEFQFAWGLSYISSRGMIRKKWKAINQGKCWHGLKSPTYRTYIYIIVSIVLPRLSHLTAHIIIQANSMGLISKTGEQHLIENNNINHNNKTKKLKQPKQYNRLYKKKTIP